MLISVNNEPNGNEFQTLINETLLSLESESKLNTKKYLQLLGNKLEDEVYDILCNHAKGTVFEGSIELISGKKFPDIIAKEYYGIEVKTTKANHWKSTGSSILESTRVEGIKRIFMLFGKMINPIEFRCRPYEECLSEVVVTHSPRYLIDMNLQKGKTIFDKIEIPYDVLRNQSNPIKTVLDYYRKQMKQGDDVWYLDKESNSSSIIIQMWHNLSIFDRNILMVQGFCLFPELVSKRPDKFNRFALWLATRKSIICPNVRDVFTAGGQGIIFHGGNEYKNIPQILMRLHSNIEAVRNNLAAFSTEELNNYWEIKTSNDDKLINWQKQILSHSNMLLNNKFIIK